MSTVVSTLEASALLKPDPPTEIEHTSEQGIQQGKNSTLGDSNDGGVDTSGDLLNYELDDEDGDDDELEALRMAALQSRKPKQKREQPTHTFKQHPERNNLTQIVLSGPPPPLAPKQLPNPATVTLPDTSRPPPGYTPLR